MLRLRVIWATQAQACTIPIGSCFCRKDVNFKAILLYHIIIIFWHHHTKTKYSYKPMVTYVQPPDQCMTSYYNPIHNLSQKWWWYGTTFSPALTAQPHPAKAPLRKPVQLDWDIIGQTAAHAKMEHHWVGKVAEREKKEVMREDRFDIGKWGNGAGCNHQFCGGGFARARKLSGLHWQEGTVPRRRYPA